MPNRKKQSTNRKQKKNRKSGGRAIKPYKHFPAIPSRIKTALRGRTYLTGTLTPSPLFQQYGLVEFLSKGGAYLDTFMNGGLWEEAIIHGARVTLRAVNMGTEPFIVAVAPLPYNWVAGSPSLSELMDNPRCVRTIVGSNTGNDTRVIVNSCSAKEVLGEAFNLAKYQMSYAQASSLAPISGDEPVWTVAISAFNALTPISYRIEVELDWNAEFFNLGSR